MFLDLIGFIHRYLTRTKIRANSVCRIYRQIQNLILFLSLQCFLSIRYLWFYQICKFSRGKFAKGYLWFLTVASSHVHLVKLFLYLVLSCHVYVHTLYIGKISYIVFSFLVRGTSVLLGPNKMRVPYSDRSVRPSVCACVRPVRKKLLSPFFSTQVWYIHQTCTNCSSWHDLLIPRGGLCPWPTFHAWVTMVRKKWLSPYYSTYWSYIHQTCTNCSSWHDLLIPRCGLHPWPTFHASETKTQNGYSEAPVMVPITIISSLVLFLNLLFLSSDIRLI